MAATAQQRDSALDLEQKAWELRQQLWTHERIARYLGVDRSTVTKALQRTSRRIIRELEGKQSEVVAQQVEQLTHIADEAMQAWNSSKQPEKDSKRIKGSPRGDAEENRLKSQNADPRYLVVAMSALENIRKLMKLDSVNVEHTIKLSPGEMAKRGQERWRKTAAALAMVFTEDEVSKDGQPADEQSLD